MKILMLKWNGIGYEDMADAFLYIGYEIEWFNFSRENSKAIEMEDQLKDIIDKEDYCFLFSFNYFPVVAEVCKEKKVKYVSWTYDSPYARLYHYSVAYPTNQVFVFDSAVFQEFYSGGLKNIHYLPMAANPNRIKKLVDYNKFRKMSIYNGRDVSFVGSLYKDNHNFFDRMDNLKDYSKGFLDGIMKAQMKIYGFNFIQDIISDNQDILEDMKKSYDIGQDRDGIESDDYLYSQYFINRKITAMEREELLRGVSQVFGLDLYTFDKDVSFEGCINHGPVDYYEYAPYVYRNSKINLNISLRSIINGVPLRCFEIMGSGGFLLSNFQQDLTNHFDAGEDYIYFESKEDMIEKIKYFLNNEGERKKIANNGLKKIESEHTFVHRAKEILSYF